LACTSGFGGMVPGEAARLRLETTASTYVARDASTRKRAERERRSVRLREQLAVRKGLLYTSDTVRPTAALVSSRSSTPDPLSCLSSLAGVCRAGTETLAVMRVRKRASAVAGVRPRPWTKGRSILSRLGGVPP
jgi:hypothetical protein